MIREGVWTTGGGQTYTYTVYDGANPYLQVSDANHLASGGATAAVSQRYLYGPAVDQILATDNGGGNVLWGLGDNVGTVRDVVNGSGAVVTHVQFDSFGKPVNPSAMAAASGQITAMKLYGQTHFVYGETGGTMFNGLGSVGSMQVYEVTSAMTPTATFWNTLTIPLRNPGAVTTFSETAAANGTTFYNCLTTALNGIARGL